MTGLELLQGMIAGRFPGPPIMQLIGFRSRRGRERPRGVRGHAGVRALQSARHRARRLCRDAAQLPAWAARCTRRCRRARATRRWSSRSAWCARSPPIPAAVRAEGKVISSGRRVATAEGRLTDAARPAARARHHDVPGVRGAGEAVAAEFAGAPNACIPRHATGALKSSFNSKALIVETISCRRPG